MTEPASLGAYLRAARRRRRVGIERAAEETRIRPDFLMRMESDEFDFLAPAYVRGFLKSYARFLGLEEGPLLEEFDERYGTGRAETAQIIALERRQRNAPRERKKMSSWTVAAVLATCVLLGLMYIGFQMAPEDEPSDGSGDRVAAGSPEPSAQPSPSRTPAPSPSPSQAIALAEGIEAEINATREPCWVLVTADGVQVYSDTLDVGQSQRFTAEDELTIVFGYPAGVDLVVNGQNLGPPGGVRPVTLQLPDDLESL
jgi:cytoskeleton protein RodZ